MNFIIWLVVGGLIGWVASMIMRTDAQQGVILNVVVGGIIGWLASLVMKTDAQQGIGLNIVVGIVGALILLAIVNLFRRGRAR